MSDPPFHSIEAGVFAALAGSDALARLDRVQIARGDRLIVEGSPADAMYLVETGRFRVSRNGVDLAVIGAGGAIGEISFLTGRPRTADVTALRAATVFRLDRAAYDALAAESPGIVRSIAAELADRLAATSARVVSDPARPRARTFVVVPAGRSPLPGPLVAMLAEAMARHRDTRVIDAAAFADAGLSGDPTTPEAVAWLNAQEVQAEAVLFVTGPEDDAWSRAAITQADQVLLVAQAGTLTAPSPLEELACAMVRPDQRRLILVHPVRRARVTGTPGWLDSRAVHMHHHVCLSDAADVARLARFLTGSATGLVCSGGGAYGAAHIGVYRALRDRGVPLDIIGGTSVGSAMALAFALDLPPEEIDAKIEEIFVRGGAMKRITVPRYAFLDHKRLDAALRAQFTDAALEDLWLPAYAVAADLSADALRVIRRGPCWEAVRASSSIPGALPAFYSRHGEMLVDGGCIDNVPFRTMHGLKTGPNVIVNVQKETGNRFYVDYPTMPGRGELLRRTLWPFGRRLPRAPGVIDTVMRSLLVAQADALKGLLPTDLLVRPPILQGAGFLAWDQHKLFHEMAYNHVRDQIAAAEADGDPAWTALSAAI